MNTRKLFPFLCLVSLLVLLAGIISACDATPGGSATSDPVIPELTTDTGWWYDTTGKVRHDVMDALNAESNAAEHDGWQIGGVIFNDSASDQMEVCTEFGNQNGLGDAKKDNGLAICIFLEKEGSDGNKPAISLAVGSGLEASINDTKAGRFLDTYFVPRRSEGNWEKGAIDLTSALHRYLMDPSNEEFKDPPTNWTLIIIIIVLIVILLFLDGTFNGFAFTMAFMEAASKGGGGGFSGGGASR